MKKLNLYLASVVLFMLICPVAAALIEGWNGAAQLADVAGKWFVFFGIGVRLLTAGIKQAATPDFTVQQILDVKSGEASFFVRELGLANISIGAVAVVALFVPAWRVPAACVGGLYLGCAGLLHAVRKPSEFNEWVALVSDLFMLVVMSAFAVSQLLGMA